MITVVDPGATRLHRLASGDQRRLTDQGDEITLATNFYTQHAKAAVRIMERHPLDKTAELLAGRRGSLVR